LHIDTSPIRRDAFLVEPPDRLPIDLSPDGIEAIHIGVSRRDDRRAHHVVAPINSQQTQGAQDSGAFRDDDRLDPELTRDCRCMQRPRAAKRD